MDGDDSLDAAVIEFDQLNVLITDLASAGYGVRGPVVRDGAIVPGDIATADDLPIGVHDLQGPGAYALRHEEDRQAFGWAVGPQSLKGEFFPSRQVLWRQTQTSGEAEAAAPSAPPQPTAYVGARPCELAAEAVLARVMLGGSHVDSNYKTRRDRAIVIAAECGAPSGTCFCTSMKTGPGVEAGFDLALTELVGSFESGQPPSPDARPTRYLIRAGSAAGRALLSNLVRSDVQETDWALRDAILAAACAKMTPFDTTDVPRLLAENMDSPEWDEVAERCLACGNCTMVCPTCFCSDVDDVSDLSGSLERTRRWSSCFELSHSYVHGGAVRSSTASRYRQWATHKLSTWHDQFGSSGCVGCGRCITWCPVGIDLTAEVRAIRQGASGTDQASREEPGND